MSPPLTSDQVLQTLQAERARFRRFLEARLGDAHDAEELLQASLVRAFRRAGQIREPQHAVAWFFGLLRRALADHYRARRARARRAARWHQDLQAAGEDHVPAPEPATTLCPCLSQVWARLSPRAERLLREIDLGGSTPALAAASLGLTPNAVSVALHRARASLRRELERHCGSCSAHACLDCDCQAAA